MQKLWLGSVGLAALLTAGQLATLRANAADLASTPYAAGFSWTSFYIGGHVGGAWDSRDVGLFDTISGEKVGIGKTKASGFLGGGQIGLDYQLAPNWVIGIEADVAGANLKSTAFNNNGSGNISTGSVQHDNSIDLFGTARGRLGYASNNWLLFGSGGFAWANEQVTRTQLQGSYHQATPGTAEKASGTGKGWAAGGGLEWGFAQNWSARVEYLHVELGPESFVFPLAHVRNDAKVTMDIARFGVNYRLGGGARY
jgi:outer membrane immunogenic protein